MKNKYNIQSNILVSRVHNGENTRSMIDLMKQSKKSIIVADPFNRVNREGYPIGHYVNFYRDMHQVLSKKYRVIIACSKEYQQYISADYITISSNQNIISTNIFYKLKEYINVYRTIKRILKNKVNNIIFESSFFLIIIISIILSRTNNKKIFLVTYIDYITGRSIKNRIKNILYKIAKNKISGIISSDNNISTQYKINTLIIPDYFGRKVCRNININKSYKYDICMLGVIRDKHKEVERIIELYYKTNIKLIIAGEFYDKNRYDDIITMSNKSDNIEIINRYITEEIYNNILEDSRFVILPYNTNKYQSSGIYYEALLKLKPLLVSSAPFFENVEKYGLGYNYNNLPQDPSELLRDMDIYRKLQNNIYEYIGKLQSESESKVLAFFNEAIG